MLHCWQICVGCLYIWGSESKGQKQRKTMKEFEYQSDLSFTGDDPGITEETVGMIIAQDDGTLTSESQVMTSQAAGLSLASQTVDSATFRPICEPQQVRVKPRPLSVCIHLPKMNNAPRIVTKHCGKLAKNWMKLRHFSLWRKILSNTKLKQQGILELFRTDSDSPPLHFRCLRAQRCQKISGSGLAQALGHRWKA